MKDTANLLKKLEILGFINLISQKLKDKADILKIKTLRKNLVTELESTKQRLAYFLQNAKVSISKAVELIGKKPILDMDFKDAYMNLCSFNTKLKLLGRDDLANQYHEITQSLIDKKADQQEQLSKSLRMVLNLPDNAEDYIKK